MGSTSCAARNVRLSAAHRPRIPKDPKKDGDKLRRHARHMPDEDPFIGSKENI